MLESHGSRNAFSFFEEISRIPRGSGNERGISDWLVAFASERGLPASQDEALNVVIKKPGTKGLERAPTVILQAHMDMVCEKNAGVSHDFEKDPIKIVVDGDEVRALGTTLGADNGATLAMALAILDSRNLRHPPLEAIFTTGEEIGLLGAARLDGSLLEGRTLLNLDSGDEGYFTSCCAGGCVVTLSYRAERGALPPGFVAKALAVRGLKGGHSGVDITKERGNACQILGRALKTLASGHGALLADVSGGSKDNAIPREARAVVAFAAGKESEVAEEVRRLEETYRREHAASDEGLELRLDDCDAPETALAQGLRDRIIAALLTIPNGVEAMSLALPGLPETSSSMGVVLSSEDKVSIVSNVRSSVGSRKAQMVERLEAIAEATGASATVTAVFPEWAYREISPLRDKATRIFAELHGKEAVVCGTHGGLECGILCEKIPGADIISFGPDIREMHTPNERMSLSSFARTWDFLVRLLEELGE